MGQELVKKEPGLLQQLLGKYVQQFLSLAGFTARQFIHDYANVAKSLHHLMESMAMFK